MLSGRAVLWTIVWAAAAAVIAAQQPGPFNGQGRPNRDVRGPWNNDVLVYRLDGDGTVSQVATFERAGVPTLARLADGRVIAAHQHFPADNDADFDKVAVHFSADDGRTWTPAAVIHLDGLPQGMRFPFDPTLVPLPDGRVRLYFTSVRQGRGPSDPAIYSAVSANGVDYTVEPGMRFGIEGRPVIDCAVALHRGVFHLFSPDNGPSLGRPPGSGPPSRSGYHATSGDGLTFTRVADVTSEAGQWLGNAQSDGELITFFGTGMGGLWTATSADGADWRLTRRSIPVRGADPGVVALRGGGWLIAATGPPVR